eukprot:3083643-Amphidinium_carterae.1
MALGLRTAWGFAHCVCAHAPHRGHGEEAKTTYFDMLGDFLQGQTFHPGLLTQIVAVVTLFGPCLPILSSLIALLAKIYSILLFGSNAHLLN